MKNTILFLGLVCVVALGCSKKEDEPAPSTNNNNNNPSNNTNSMQGDWTVTIYDSATVTAPMAAIYKATASSTTAGTVHFDITFDGSAHKTEDATYTLSNSNANVAFTKTGGDFSVLSGGGTWTVEEMTANTLRMKSAMNLYIKMTK